MLLALTRLSIIIYHNLCHPNIFEGVSQWSYPHPSSLGYRPTWCNLLRERTFLSHSTIDHLTHEFYYLICAWPQLVNLNSTTN